MRARHHHAQSSADRRPVPWRVPQPISRPGSRTVPRAQSPAGSRTGSRAGSRTSSRARILLRLAVDASPARAWERLWDLNRHTAAVPLTTVRSLDGRALRAGSRFTATTRLGPLRLADEMVVREWRPPRRAVIEKVGRLLGGMITATIEPGSPVVVTWDQHYRVRAVPDALAGLARPVVQAAYRSALQRILEAGRGSAGRRRGSAGHRSRRGRADQGPARPGSLPARASR